MKNLVSTEKMLKHWLKKRVTITTATVVGFLLMGTAAFGEAILKEKTPEPVGNKLIFVEGKTYDTGVMYNNGTPVTYVENNGTINITEAEKLKDKNAIRLQEEGEGSRKELINNGDIIVELGKNENEDRKDISVAFSRGNLGRAIYLMTSDEFLVWYHKIIKICKSVKNMDTLEIQQQIRELISECSDIYEALDLIQLWYRDLMMYKVTKDMNGLVFSNERKALMDLASLSSYEGIEEIMDAIETCRIRLKANVNTELALELLLLNMKEK